MVVYHICSYEAWVDGVAVIGGKAECSVFSSRVLCVYHFKTPSGLGCCDYGIGNYQAGPHSISFIVHIDFGKIYRYIFNRYSGTGYGYVSVPAVEILVF